jgi:hypothetical protein
MLKRAYNITIADISFIEYLLLVEHIDKEKPNARTNEDDYS